MYACLSHQYGCLIEIRYTSYFCDVGKDLKAVKTGLGNDLPLKEAKCTFSVVPLLKPTDKPL